MVVRSKPVILSVLRMLFPSSRSRVDSLRRKTQPVVIAVLGLTAKRDNWNNGKGSDELQR
jgi:hypothetical protein